MWINVFILLAYFNIFDLIKANVCNDGECINIKECSYIQLIYHKENPTNYEQEYLKKRQCLTDQMFCCEHRHMENKPFPGMAQIETTYKNKKLYLFGGVLIKSKFVLITAHSVEICDMHNMTITGVLLSESYYKYKRYDVERVIIHENYKETSIPENDIALIYLSQTVIGQKKQKSIVLPHHGDISHFINVNFISWIQFSHSDMLRAKKYTFIIFKKETCITNYYDFNQNMHLCGETKKKYLENYKFGGFLLGPGDTLIGLLSFRQLYGEAPYVFTYVAKYLDWIKKSIK